MALRQDFGLVVAGDYEPELVDFAGLHRDLFRFSDVALQHPVRVKNFLKRSLQTRCAPSYDTRAFCAFRLNPTKGTPGMQARLKLAFALSSLLLAACNSSSNSPRAVPAPPAVNLDGPPVTGAMQGRFDPRTSPVP